MSRLGLTVAALILLGLGFYIGVAAEKGREPDTQHTATEALQASAIGDPDAGRELYVSQGCSICHQFEGEGGTDAPALDFMTDELDATDLAEMSGSIWNHLPAMEEAFKEEGIPFPAFAPGEMEDLIAYLHGGGQPPNVGAQEEMGQ